MVMPKGNIWWKNITPRMCVIEHDHYFEVRDGRKRYVANWSSFDAHKAQRTLKRRARKGC
jgi:hypothetical protein